MNLILKQVLIMGTVFTVILWFQHKDDQKINRVRKTLFEKYKLPLLVSSIIGLMMNLKTFTNLNCNTNETLTEVTIITPINNCKKITNSNNFGTKINQNNLSWVSKNPTEQQIYTDLPDF